MDTSTNRADQCCELLAALIIKGEFAKNTAGCISVNECDQEQRESILSQVADIVAAINRLYCLMVGETKPGGRKIVPFDDAIKHGYRTKVRLFADWWIAEINANNGDAWHFIDDWVVINLTILLALDMSFNVSDNPGHPSAAAYRFFLDVSEFLGGRV